MKYSQQLKDNITALNIKEKSKHILTKEFRTSSTFTDIMEVTNWLGTDTTVKFRIDCIMADLTLDDAPTCTCGNKVTTVRGGTLSSFCSKKCANSNTQTRQKMIDAKNHKLEDARKLAINDQILSLTQFIEVLQLGVSRPQSWEPFLIKHKALSTFLSYKKYDDELPTETLYRLQNNLTERPLCQCGENHIQFRKGKEGGYIGFCSTTCSALLKHNKIKMSETCMEHFGVTHQLKSKEVQEKIKQTCLERHGVEHPLQSSDIMNKRDETMIERFGTKHAVHSEELVAKTKETCLLRYGVEHSFQAVQTKQQMKKTYQAKYGIDFPSQSHSIRAKIRAVCLERYGVDNPSKSQDVIDKIKATHIEKYGCHYLLQPHVQLRTAKIMMLKYGVRYYAQTGLQAGMYKWKPYTLPSGKIAMLQGYENHLFDSLLQIHDESEILSDKDKMPQIWYMQNGTSHRYFPDFYIPKENLVYEVKSEYTFIRGMLDKSIIPKIYATITAGYNYEIQILNNKGETMTKIRVNFYDEAIENTEGINLSRLCNHLMSKLSPELKEKLKDVSPEEYYLHFDINIKDVD